MGETKELLCENRIHTHRSVICVQSGLPSPLRASIIVFCVWWSVRFHQREKQLDLRVIFHTILREIRASTLCCFCTLLLLGSVMGRLSFGRWVMFKRMAIYTIYLLYNKWFRKITQRYIELRLSVICHKQHMTQDVVTDGYRRNPLYRRMGKLMGLFSWKDKKPQIKRNRATLRHVKYAMYSNENV